MQDFDSDYFTYSTLIVRGWNNHRIKKLLGAPDYREPFERKSLGRRLATYYNRDRVLAAEKLYREALSHRKEKPPKGKGAPPLKPVPPFTLEEWDRMTQVKRNKERTKYRRRISRE